VVRFDSGFEVEAAKLEEMQHRAHRYCFIANSLADSVEVRIDPAKERPHASG
jgi:organic hydroperoxide reductase OsmC/OhrA